MLGLLFYAHYASSLPHQIRDNTGEKNPDAKTLAVKRNKDKMVCWQPTFYKSVSTSFFGVCYSSLLVS